MTMLHIGKQRSAPWGFRLEALFGGAAAGVWILGIALTLLLMKSMEASTISWLQYHGKMQTTTGVVSSVSYTGHTAGKHVSRLIYCAYYTFTSPDGGTHYGKSFYTDAGGSANDTSATATAGDQVKVEFRPDQPAISNIAGMRSTLHDHEGVVSMLVILLLLALFIASIIVVIQRFLEGWQAIRLLECGRHVQARMTELEIKNADSPKSRSYLVTFSYPAPGGGAYSITKEFQRPKKEWLNYYQLHGYETTTQPPPEETVIYDPHNPNKQVLLAHLSFDFKLEADGSLTGGNLTRGIACCLPPAIGVIAMFCCLLPGSILPNIFTL